MKTSPRPASARVSWWLETSFIKTPFPGRVSIPSSFVSLFIFNILSYLPSKTMGCFSARLMSAASDQKLFCELCSPFNCSFHEFVGEKVVSPSYSSTILAPPPLIFLMKPRHGQHSPLTQEAVAQLVCVRADDTHKGSSLSGKRKQTTVPTHCSLLSKATWTSLRRKGYELGIQCSS